MGVGASLFFSTTEPENCLEWRIRPSDDQYDSQKERWKDLAEHLLEDLKERSGCPISSWLQGSYKFGTQVRPASIRGEFDIDLGMYFHWSGSPRSGDHAPLHLKYFVQQSLIAYAEDNANDAINVDEPKAKCSRIHFEGGFHIDIPAYHLDRNTDARALATDSDKWENSDPKAIYKWWKLITNSDRARYRRIVRYLKMWAALKFDKTD